MRTTIDLPADLHQIVTSVASHTRRSMNQTVAELIRRGLSLSPDAGGVVASPAVRIDEQTGLPVIRTSRPVTAEDVRALGDE